MRTALFGLLFVSCLGGCAQSGYHYEGFTQVANDTCLRWKDSLNSAGAIEKLNATIGKDKGVPKQVTSVTDPATGDTIQLSSVGIAMPVGGAESMWCHVTLTFADGTNDSGMLALADPGEYAPVQLAWLSDEDIARARAQFDRLYTAKNLLVTPDLTTPEIQRCVGRLTALGVGEQFPGQLWARCADKNAQH